MAWSARFRQCIESAAETDILNPSTRSDVRASAFHPSAGSVASFGTEQESAEKTSFPGNLGGHFEEFVDEPILTPDATPAQPPHLALPNYVHRLIALNRSSRSLEFAKPLLGVHSPFDRAMVLLDDVVQILDGSVAAPAAARRRMPGSSPDNFPRCNSANGRWSPHAP